MDLPAILAHYRAHGWARLGVVADEATLEALRARADDIMLGRVVYEGLFFQHDSGTGRYEDLEFGRGWVGPSLSYRKIEKLERDPLFRAWLESPLLRARGARGGRPRRGHLSRHPVQQEREGGTELPWHQDGGSFWGLDRDPELQIWTALDDAPVEAGCVEVLDASHLGGLATPLGGSIPRDVVDAASGRRRADVRFPRARARCSSSTTTSGTARAPTPRAGRAAVSPWPTCPRPRSAFASGARSASSRACS